MKKTNMSIVEHHHFTSITEVVDFACTHSNKDNRYVISTRLNESADLQFLQKDISFVNNQHGAYNIKMTLIFNKVSLKMNCVYQFRDAQSVIFSFKNNNSVGSNFGEDIIELKNMINGMFNFMKLADIARKIEEMKPNELVFTFIKNGTKPSSVVLNMNHRVHDWNLIFNYFFENNGRIVPGDVSVVLPDIASKRRFKIKCMPSLTDDMPGTMFSFNEDWNWDVCVLFMASHAKVYFT